MIRFLKNLKNILKKYINLFLTKITNYRFILLSPKGRISFYILSTEPRIRDLKKYNENKYKYIFINPNNVPNKFVQYKYSKFVNFINLNTNNSKGFKYIIKKSFLTFLNFLVTGTDSKKNFVSNKQLLHYSFNKYWRSGDPIIKFTNSEVSKIIKGLPSSLDLAKPIVILNYRESSYYKQLKKNNINNIGNQIDELFSYRNPLLCQ